MAFYLVALALEVSRVLDADLNLFGNLRIIDARPEPGNAHQGGVINSGSVQQIACGSFAGQRHVQIARQRSAKRVGWRCPQTAESFAFALDPVARAAHRRMALLGHAAQLMPDCAQTQVGIVLAQMQAVLGARGEHPIRLAGAVGHQVVDQDPDVGLFAARAPCALALRGTRRR